MSLVRTNDLEVSRFAEGGVHCRFVLERKQRDPVVVGGCAENRCARIDVEVVLHVTFHVPGEFRNAEHQGSMPVAPVRRELFLRQGRKATNTDD